MARLFNDVASEYLDNANAVVNALGCTWACWYCSDDAGAKQTLISIGHTVIGSSNKAILRAGATIRFNISGTFADTTVNWTANAWEHFAGTAAVGGSIAVYLNGGNKGTNVGAAWGASDVTSIGVTQDVALQDYMSGRIAEAVLLNIAATDYQIWLHAQGMPAPLVWPGWAIAAYHPLFETDRDFLAHNYNMAPHNTPGWAPHPPKVLEYWRRYKVRAVATQTTQARIAPQVWVGWSSKGRSPGGVTHEMSASAAAASATPDDVSLPVSRTLAGASAGASATSDSLALAVARAMTALQAVASATPDTVDLAVSRSVTASMDAASATTDTAALAVARALAATIDADTATPDDIELLISVFLAAATAAQSATPDTAALAVDRSLLAVLSAASATPDDITLLVAGLATAAARIFTVPAESRTLEVGEENRTLTVAEEGRTYTV